MTDNPHLARAPVITGAPLETARAAAVLVHGRNQDEQVMIDAAQRVALDDVAYVMPVAAGGTWYDQRYTEPAAELEPQLSWALAAVEAALAVTGEHGMSISDVVLAGFSQGACLVAELCARRPRPLRGVGVLTGSLIGPPGQRTTPASVRGLAMYFASSRHDAWVAFADAEATERAFRSAGSQTRFDALDDREHLISDRAVDGLRGLLSAR